jgi:excisionase family DNA binding protein
LISSLVKNRLTCKRNQLYTGLIRMERITFDQLPEMVALILQRLDRIEQLLTGNHSEVNFMKEVLTFNEAKEFMGVSKSTLYKMSANRIIPIYKPTGGRIYFKREDLLAYMQKNRLMSQEEINQLAFNYVSQNPVKRRAERSGKK